MNYPFILKFSALSNLSDARYAAGFWADFIGFCFDPGSPDYIEPAKAKEIAAWVSGPMLTGEFTMQPPEWIRDFVTLLPLDAIQIPSNYPHPEIFETENVKFIIAVNDLQHAEHLQKADIFITKDPEIYHHLKLHNDKPVILETNDMKTDASLLDGIAFTGGTEAKPGMRNQQEWTDFLEKWEGKGV